MRGSERRGGVGRRTGIRIERMGGAPLGNKKGVGRGSGRGGVGHGDGGRVGRGGAVGVVGEGVDVLGRGGERGGRGGGGRGGRGRGGVISIELHGGSGGFFSFFSDGGEFYV